MAIPEKNIMGMVVARQQEDGVILFIWNKRNLRTSQNQITAITDPEQLQKTVKELQTWVNASTTDPIEKELAQGMLDFINSCG